MATDIELSTGQHTVKWSKTGYDDLIATINVTDTGVSCVSVQNGACYSSTPPGVLIPSSFTVVGYLKASGAVTDFDSWVASKGGKDSIEYADVLEIGDAYLGFVDIGFTPNYTNVLTAGDYYLGLG
ncbi:hypothetical protein DRN97_00030 [Methanosarcinales archaeon]|nr:MAG: hypothetical protein DRN97_00030 [Methanosarcinales archaeon]